MTPPIQNPIPKHHHPMWCPIQATHCLDPTKANPTPLSRHASKTTQSPSMPTDTTRNPPRLHHPVNHHTTSISFRLVPTVIPLASHPNYVRLVKLHILITNHPQRTKHRNRPRMRRPVNEAPHHLITAARQTTRTNSVPWTWTCLSQT